MQVAQLQVENEMMRKVGKTKTGSIAVSSLPKEADPTSDDVITALNEQLIQVVSCCCSNTFTQRRQCIEQ